MEEVEKCVYVCLVGRVGVLRSAHYVAKTKTEKHWAGKAKSRRAICPRSADDSLRLRLHVLDWVIRLLHCVDETVTSAASEKMKGGCCACANTPLFLLFHMRFSAFPFSLLFYLVESSETDSPGAAMLAQTLFFSAELDHVD